MTMVMIHQKQMSKVAEDTKFLFHRKFQDFKIYFASEAE